jgi:hypothetical protein
VPRGAPLPDTSSTNGPPFHTVAGSRRTLAELLIDCEEDRTLRAVLVGMLREADREPERLGGRVLRHLSAM